MAEFEDAINYATYGEIAVEFDVWGQKATTVFYEDSELLPLVWCQRLIQYDMGMPVRVYLHPTGTDIVAQPHMKALVQQWIEGG